MRNDHQRCLPQLQRQRQGGIDRQQRPAEQAPVAVEQVAQMPLAPRGGLIRCAAECIVRATIFLRNGAHDILQPLLFVIQGVDF